MGSSSELFCRFWTLVVWHLKVLGESGARGHRWADVLHHYRFGPLSLGGKRGKTDLKFPYLRVTWAGSVSDGSEYGILKFRVTVLMGFQSTVSGVMATG